MITPTTILSLFVLTTTILSQEIQEIQETTGAGGVAIENRKAESLPGVGLGAPYGGFVGNDFLPFNDFGLDFGFGFGAGCGGGLCSQGPCSQGPCGDGILGDGLLFEGAVVNNEEALVDGETLHRRLNGPFLGSFGFFGPRPFVAADNELLARARLRNAAAKRCDATRFDRIRKRANDVAFKQASAFRNRNAAVDATHFTNKHAAAKVCCDKNKALCANNEIVKRGFGF